MAAVTYFMLCNEGNIIVAVQDNAGFDTSLVGGHVRSASFSVNEADNPDVLKSQPLVGDVFTDDPVNYIPQLKGSKKPFLKLSWSGSGVVDPDDQVYELVANGSNQCVLTIQKWNSEGDEAIGESGDKFSVCVIGHTLCPEARFELDGNGEHQITFTPKSDDKGEIEVVIIPVSSDCCSRAGIRLRLV